MVEGVGVCVVQEGKDETKAAVEESGAWLLVENGMLQSPPQKKKYLMFFSLSFPSHSF